MNYYCKRCRYNVSRKDDLRKHLNRKKPCKVKYLDIPIETLIMELEDKNHNYSEITPDFALNSANLLPNKIDTINPLECEYCKKVFKEKRYLQQHINRNNCKEKDKKEKAKQEETDLMKQMMAQKDEEVQLLRKQIEILMTKIGNTNI